ncbi:DUF6415 family natural product biosynthesis protein [Streptomyces sp. NPDC059134]|uniref:DUF6415 family natural product biosynthesis protein n=1 Tax=Streptomyces sp. NPDC059134 TaxID=3346738 RepID=UPI00367A4270
MAAVLTGLRRSALRDAVGEDLYDDLGSLYGELNIVLDEYARPTADEIGSIAEQFRRRTTQLIKAVPHLIRPYPDDEIRRLIDLRSERPAAEHAYRHALRFAMAIVELLDLMGDDAP